MEQGTLVTGVEGLVMDAHGMAIPPKRPFVILEDYLRKVRASWPSKSEMAASIEANAPTPRGLPEGSPNPNDVYEANGVLYRHIVDPEFLREMVVRDGKVREQIQFKKRPIALTMSEARRMTDTSTFEDDHSTDFWNGFTWLRGGYSPERDFPSMVKAAMISVGDEPLIFEVDASPTDVAHLRHEMARLDRNSQIMPIMTDAVASPAPSPLPASLEDVLSEAPPTGKRTPKGAESEG